MCCANLIHGYFSGRNVKILCTFIGCELRWYTDRMIIARVYKGQ